jgi:hypothetical protein
VTDPWVLLREARRALGWYHDALICKRIDAALAEYDKNNGWIVCGCWANYRGELGEGFVCDNRVPLDSPFFWRIKRKDGTGIEGWADSRDEAKEKANNALRSTNG